MVVKKKDIGAMIILAVFLGLFIFTCFVIGLFGALITWGSAVGLTAIVAFADNLMESDKDEPNNDKLKLRNGVMMSWGYRVIRYADGSLAICEVYFDEEGQPQSKSDPVCGAFNGIKEMREELKLISGATRCHILDDSIFEDEPDED